MTGNVPMHGNDDLIMRDHHDVTFRFLIFNFAGEG
jgi:hypothetical protein